MSPPVESARSPWSLADVPEPTDSAGNGYDLELTETARYGTLDGAGAMARVSTVAANDSFVAVSAFRACEIVVFSRRDHRERFRFGQCGEGPGDFREVGAMAFHGDPLVVSERGPRVQYLTPAGSVIHTILLDSAALPNSYRGMRQLAIWRDSMLVATTLQSPNRLERPFDRGKPYVRVIPGSGRGMRFGAIVDGRGPDERYFGIVRDAAACVVPSGTPQGTATVVAMHRWNAQLVALELDSLARRRPAVRLNRVLTSVPIRATESKDVPNMMFAPPIDIACAGELALGSSRWFNLPDSSGTLASDAYLIAVHPATGRHGVRHITARDRTEALGGLLAGHGDVFFVGHNTRYGYPQLVEMRVRLVERAK
jgi:hypothetical protein